MLNWTLWNRPVHNYLIFVFAPICIVMFCFSFGMFHSLLNCENIPGIQLRTFFIQKEIKLIIQTYLNIKI